MICGMDSHILAAERKMWKSGQPFGYERLKIHHGDTETRSENR